MSNDIILKIIEILADNSFTSKLLLLGVACVILAILGELPPIRIILTGKKALALGLFGVILIFTSVALAWVLALPKSDVVIVATPTPVPLIPTSTDTPLPTITQIIEEVDTPTETPTPELQNTSQPTETPTTTTTPSPTNTLTPEPADTSTPPMPIPTKPIVIIDDLLVPATAGQGVSFIAPVDGTYRFTIKGGVYCTGANFCRSILHAYIDRDIVWGDWYSLPHPIEQDYEIGCWEQQTAQNKDCGTGKSATLYLKSGQTVKWIIMEDRNSYGDNTGGITLGIEVTQ